MSFKNATQNYLNEAPALTENGMKARKTTASAVLDFFGNAGSARGKSLVKEFTAALVENQELAIRALLWTRDIRSGAGERKQFRDLLASLDASDPALAGAIMHKIPELGRGDDLFVYQDPDSGLAVQLPLIASSELGKGTSDYLAFPHSPGVFDWPVDKYLPIMMPELTFGDKVIVPSFYGKNCTTSMGLRNSLNFKYDQPELITKDEQIVPGLGSCKVTWSFKGGQIGCEFCFSVKQQVQLDKMRYILAIAAPHSRYRVATAFTLGEGGHRTEVVKDDFHAEWKELEVVSEDPEYRKPGRSYNHHHRLQKYL